MDKKYFADIVINKEKLSDGRGIFVTHCTNLGISSQGYTIEESMKNIQEAIELVLEEDPNRFEELRVLNEPPIFSFVEVKKNAKASNIVR